MGRILHIFVKAKYWYEAGTGLKNKEYRRIIPYWTKRLVRREYDFIYYHKGYTKQVQVFEWDGYVKTVLKHPEFGDKPVNVYAISLSKPV